MRARIVLNTLKSPLSESIGAAVLDAIGERPEHEIWTVSISESSSADYVVSIEGPVFRWRRGFFGASEHTPAFVLDEVRKAVNGTSKATIVPLHSISANFLIEKPITIFDSVQVETVSGLLTPENFKLWGEYISPQTVKAIVSARIALVHRFRSNYTVSRTEKDSEDLLFKIFTCLRLLKPNRTAFAAVQVNLAENGSADVIRFSEPSRMPLDVPVSESLNRVTVTDLERLASLASPFLQFLSNSPAHVQRAVHYFNLGYQPTGDSAIQLLAWMMGVECFFNDSDSILPREELFARITTLLGADSDIHEEFPDPHEDSRSRLKRRTSDKFTGIRYRCSVR